MLRNIVFDFGGILTGLDKNRCVAALQKVGAGRIAYYVDECKQEDLFHTLEVGECTVHEFCEEARRQCSYTDENGIFHPCETTDEQIVWAWNELLTGVPQSKLNIVKQLHDCGKYNVMVLSNTNVVHWDRAVREFFPGGVDKYFHKVYLSCDMHMVKPSPEIFLSMLSDSGCKADETLFIDDSAKNCDAANAVGIQTIHDPSFNSWPEELKAKGIMELND